MSGSFPDVSISSREVDLDAATTSVRYGEVDVAFGLDYPDAPMPGNKAVQLVRLQPETFAVAVAADSVKSRRYVELETLRDLDWILPPESSQYGRAIRSGFRRRGFEPRVVHEVTDTAASLQLAAAGLGATVMTGLMHSLNTSLDLTALTMREPLTRQIVLITRGEVAQRQPVRMFVEEAESVVDELLAALSW
jgi:DNA-binding transcriptional LysR family regulator